MGPGSTALPRDPAQRCRDSTPLTTPEVVSQKSLRCSAMFGATSRRPFSRDARRSCAEDGDWPLRRAKRLLHACRPGLLDAAAEGTAQQRVQRSRGWTQRSRGCSAARVDLGYSAPQRGCRAPRVDLGYSAPQRGCRAPRVDLALTEVPRLVSAGVPAQGRDWRNVTTVTLPDSPRKTQVTQRCSKCCAPQRARWIAHHPALQQVPHAPETCALSQSSQCCEVHHSELFRLFAQHLLQR